MSDASRPAVIPETTAASLDERKATAAQLGQRLMRILAPTRIKSLSLHDAAGELLWRNGGEYGLRERRLLQDALDAFSLDATLQHLERDLENARALLFCSRTPRGDREGVALAVVGSRRRPDINPEALRERVLTTMRRFGALVPLPEAAVPVTPDLPVFQIRGSDRPQQAPFELAGVPSTTAEAESAEVPPLRSRSYARLRNGGHTRRYEIADNATHSLEQDLERARRLITLVKRRGALDAPAPASFALPLCAASVQSEDFLDRLTPALEEAALAEDVLGFCLPAIAWQHDPDAAARFIGRCADLKCFVALDDFNLTSNGFALLRGAALRCLKIDAAITASALEDKFAHANVAGIAKAARVLGLYCVAKGVKTPEEARWLAQAGVEFADRMISRAGKGAATTRSARALKLSK
jgi:EAL domain